MLESIRRHNKKILAVVGVFLMIAFIASDGYRGSQQRQGDETIGKASGQEVTSAQLREATYHWELLTDHTSQTQMVLGQPTPINFVLERIAARLYPLAELQAQQQFSFAGRQLASMFALQMARGVVDQLSSDKVAYLLLVQEARRLGADPSPVAVEQALAELSGIPTRDPSGRQRAVADFLAVLELFDRVAAAVRISPAEALHGIVDSPANEQGQQISSLMVEVKAENFRKEVSEPGTEALVKFFEQYKDKLPGDGELGIGFKFPNRVSVQYIRIPKGKIADTITLKEIRDFHAANLARFTVFPDEPATRPTTNPATNPATAPTTQVAATQPTTRPLTDPKVREEIRDEIAAGRTEQVARAVRSFLEGHWTNYRVAVRAGQKADAAVADYENYILLRNAAVSVQTGIARGVLPEVREEGRLLSAGELTALFDIGKAQLAEDGGPRIPFPQYATELFEPFMSEADVKRAQRQRLQPLAPYQPSQLLRDEQGNYYIFRITRGEKSHAPAEFNAVESQVRKAWNDHQAYLKAKDFAGKLAELARQKGSIVSAVNETPGIWEIVETGMFSRGEPLEKGFKHLSPEAMQKLTTDAYKLLATRLRTGQQYPVELIELPKSGSVVIAELDEARPATRSGQFPTLVDQRMRVFEMARAGQMLPQWFNPEEVKARAGFVEEQRQREDQPPQPSGPAPVTPVPLGR